jgi:hypothetical protein
MHVSLLFCEIFTCFLVVMETSLVVRQGIVSLSTMAFCRFVVSGSTEAKVARKYMDTALITR